MRLRRRRRQTLELTADQIIASDDISRQLMDCRLSTDPGTGCEPGRQFVFNSVDDLRDAWEATRDVLLARFIERHPGRRPLSWWIFDHGQERPFVAEVSPEREAMLRTVDDRRPTCDVCLGFLHTRHWPAVQEPEEEYLLRVGLLVPGESERIPWEEYFGEDNDDDDGDEPALCGAGA